MQKNLKYPTALVKNIWMYFLDAGSRGLFKSFIYTSSGGGVGWELYVDDFASVC
jgi:hypothetical protein